MKRVCPRLQSHIDDSAGLPAKFCRRILLDVEFLDGVNRQDGRRVARNARSVDDALPGKRLAIEEAVDDISVVLGAKSVGACRGKTASGIAYYSGTQL